MALNVGGYSISLDCGEQDTNVNFVSHAHSDHTSGLRKGRKVIASEITKDLIECRHPRKKIELAEKPKCLKLLNAGHILGSNQLYVSSDELGASIIYSGDYQMDRSAVAEPIETRHADILIIDSTYPEKDVVFGERSEITSSIQKYSSEKIKEGIVLFGAYALGKSQELIKIANEIGIAPVVDEKVCRINEVYAKHGKVLDYVSGGKDENELESMLRGNFLGITSVYNLKDVAYSLSNTYRKKVFTAVATGFARMLDMGSDAQFPLSDHADFRQAIEYIEACGPKTIYTRGNGESAALFAKNLSSEGYRAKVFSGKVELEEALAAR